VIEKRSAAANLGKGLGEGERRGLKDAKNQGGVLSAKAKTKKKKQANQMVRRKKTCPMKAKYRRSDSQRRKEKKKNDRS